MNLDRDDVVALALIHLIEVLGEAARAVTVETRARHPELPWSNMAATRDRLIHGYFSVDLNVVWQIARQDLPPVARSLATLLDELEDE